MTNLQPERARILSLDPVCDSILKPTDKTKIPITEEGTMSETKTYPVPAEFASQANISAAQYEEMYRQSVEDPEGFWSEQAENYLSWFKDWLYT